MPANSSRSRRAAKTQRPASSLGSRRRFDTARRSVSALGAAALLLLGARGGNAATTYVDSGSTANFSTAFAPAIPAGGTAATDTLSFTNTTASTQTDDLTAAQILNAIALSFTNSGALTLNPGATNNTINLASGGTIALANTAQLINNLNLAIGGNTTITESGSPATFGGVISGSTGTITLNNTVGSSDATHALTLTGANTYTGNWIVNSSAGNNNNYANTDLILSSGTGPTIAGNLQIGNSAVATGVNATAANQFNSTSIVSYGGSGNSYLGLNVGQTIAGLSSTVSGAAVEVNRYQDATNYGNQTLTLAGSGTYAFTGYIRNTDGSGASTLAILKTGSGTQTFSGTESYTGGTTVNAGTLKQGGTNTLGSTSGTMTVNTGGTVDLGGYALGVGSLNGTGGVVQDTGAAATLTVGNNNATGSYAGVIGGGTGAITVSKTGTGTETLTGANTYTGGTTISAGTLATGGTGTTAGAGTYTLSGGTLQLGSTGANGGLSTGAITNTSVAASVINATASSPVMLSNALGVSNGGGITFGGTQALTVNGAFTTVSGGTPGVNFNDTSLVTLAGTVGLGSSNADGLLFGGTGNGLISGAVTNGTSTNEKLTYSGNGTLTLSGNDTYTGATTVSSGTLALSGNNSSATGGTTLTAGTLDVNSAGALGTGAFAINGGTIDNTSGAAVTSQTNNPLITIGGNFAYSTAAGTANNNLNLGTGAVTDGASGRVITLNGLGALTLGGVVTNTAGANNTLTVNNGTGTGTTSALNLGGFAISNSGTSYTETINGSGNVNITGPVTNGSTSTAGVLTYSGTGVLTLGGANVIGSATNINSGTVNLTGSIATTNGYVVTGGTGNFNESGTGVISGTQGFSQSSTGTSTLSGANTYTNTTYVNNGTLKLDFTAAGAPTSNIIKSGGNLTLGNALPGGILNVKGSAATGFIQTLGTLTLGASSNDGIVLTPGASGTDAVLFGSLSAGANSALNVNYAAGTTNGATIGNDYVQFTTAPTLTNGIISANDTVTDTGGTGFATTNAAKQVIRLADNGTSGLPVSGGAATSNYFVNQSYSTTDTTKAGSLVEALSGNVAANTVTVDTTGLTTGANLALGTNTLSITNNGGFDFNGPNPYTITAGTGGGLKSASAAGSITLNNNSTGGVTVSAPILNNAGSSVTLVGPGTTTFSGANTYTGATNINGGNLQLGAANTLINSAVNIGTASGASGLTFSSGIGTFNVASLNTANSVNPTVTLTDTGGGPVNLQVGTGGTTSSFLGGSITGVAGSSLTVVGGGTFDASVYGGNNLNFSTQIIVSNGTLFDGGNNNTFSGITLGNSTTNATFKYDGHGGGVPLPALTVGGSGTDINDNIVNYQEYIGGLNLSNNVTLVNTNNGALTYIQGSGVSGTGNITASNDGTGENNLFGFSGPVNNTGSITFNNVAADGGAIGTNAGTPGNANSISGVIGANVTGITQNDINNLSISGANTAYKGDTTLTSGAVVLGNANALQNSVVNTGGGSLSFGTLTTAALGGLTGSTNLNLDNTTPAAIALTIGNSNTTNGSATNPNTLAPVYSGALTNTAGSASVIKVGTDTQTLDGANTYTGATAVNAGTLALGTGGSLGATAVSVASGATLAATGTTSNTIGGTVAASGGALSLNNSAINALNITGAGTDLSLTGDTLGFDIMGATADTINASGVATASGTNTINLTGIGALTGASNTIALITGGTGTAFNLSNFMLGTETGANTSGYTYSLATAGGGSILDLIETASTVSDAPQAYFTGSQGASLNTAANYVTTPAGGTTASIGPDSNVFIAANTGVANTNYTAATVAAPTTINSLNLGTGAASGGGTSITGSTLTINAAGTGNNTAGSGITDNSAPAGAAATAADTVGSNIALGNSQTVTVANAPTTLTLSGTISDGTNGAAALIKAGNGVLTITGSGNNYSGGTTVNSGTVNLAAAGADGSGALIINGGTVTVNTTNSNGGTNSALGAGGVTLSGGTLANANLTATPATGATPQTNNYQNGGLLTLTNGTTSVIDFGSGNTGGVFSFTGLSGMGTLDVLNWNGNFTDGSAQVGGDGIDQLFIGGTLTQAQLADIVFVNPAGAAAGSYPAAQLSDGEVAAAPEPSQYGMMGLMAFGLGGLILRAKKRQAAKIDTAD